MLSLKDKLLHISSYREQPKNRTVRVLEVRDCQKKPIHIKSIMRKRLSRSRYLLTVHDLDKDEFRSYYDEYVRFTELSWWGRLCFRLHRWWENN